MYRRQLNKGRLELDPHAQQSWHPTTFVGVHYHDLDFYTTSVILNMAVGWVGCGVLALTIDTAVGSRSPAPDQSR